MAREASESYPWLWDVDMDAPTFERILRGEAAERGVPDVRWVSPPDAAEFAAAIERLVDSLTCL